MGYKHLHWSLRVLIVTLGLCHGQSISRTVLKLNSSRTSTSICGTNPLAMGVTNVSSTTISARSTPISDDIAKESRITTFCFEHDRCNDIFNYMYQCFGTWYPDLESVHTNEQDIAVVAQCLCSSFPSSSL